MTHPYREGARAPETKPRDACQSCGVGLHYPYCGICWMRLQEEKIVRLEAENAKLRTELEAQSVFERVWENPDAFGGETEGSDGWECAICEAAHFATKEELTHEPTCALYRSVPSESEGQ